MPKLEIEFEAIFALHFSNPDLFKSDCCGVVAVGVSVGGVDILGRTGKASLNVTGRVASISIYQVSIITGLGCIQLSISALDNTCVIAERISCLTCHTLRVIGWITGVAICYLTGLKLTEEGSCVNDIPHCACGAVAAGGTGKTVGHRTAAGRAILICCIYIVSA